VEPSTGAKLGSPTREPLESRKVKLGEELGPPLEPSAGGEERSSTRGGKLGPLLGDERTQAATGQKLGLSLGR
jgi:hypothetical protein